MLFRSLGLCSEDLGDDEDEQAQEPLSASDRAAAIESVPMALAGIFAYWRQRRGALATGTVRRSSRKVGRNEPCPCGSGKKYKNCCGSPLKATRH